MDLIVHIGLPKTGTTTIQDYLSRNVSDVYLGKFSLAAASDIIDNEEQKTRKKLFSKFRDAAPVAPNAQIDEIKIRYWIERAKKHLVETGAENIILSDERLSSRSGGLENRWPIGPIANDYHEGKDRPFPEFLKLLREYWVGGDVKVILGIRNQPEWLASLYAQRSYRIPRACQENFEREIDDVLAKRGDFLEWNVLIKELQEVLHDGMLKVMLLEDINEVSFWDDLSDFVNIKQVEYKFSGLKRSNVNSLGGVSWKIKKRAMPKGAFFDWREALHGNLQRQVKRCSMKSYVFIENAFADLGVLGRGKEFGLTEPVLNKIQERYKRSNRDLAGLLGRDDLSEMGYLKS